MGACSVAAEVLSFLPRYCSAKLIPSPGFDSSRPSLLLDKNFYTNCLPKTATRFENVRARVMKVRALDKSQSDQNPVAPLRLESPIGQLLSQIIQTHPHLLPAAIDQHLERLQTDQDSQREETSSASQDSLYKRIAEVKVKERRRAIEDIIYCLIIRSFIENNISLNRPVSALPDPALQIGWQLKEEQKLKSLHSPDVLELVQSHLSIVLGEKIIGPLSPIIQISKILLGKLYAASIMYGYFLKRVDERYQLERTMKTLPTENNLQNLLGNMELNPLWDMESMVLLSPEDGFQPLDTGEEVQTYKLRSYVTYLDAETLRQYATVRSKEAVSVIERHTQALFGRPDITMEDGFLIARNDEVVSIAFTGLTLLVLEAVALGTFLWEAEGYVESKYHFTAT